MEVVFPFNFTVSEDCSATVFYYWNIKSLYLEKPESAHFNFCPSLLCPIIFPMKKLESCGALFPASSLQ